MTKIFGHRGASGYAPENTLEAFKLAADMGSDGIELDVQLTKDGQVVVCHDEMIDRTSDHKGFVKDFTLEELKSFNFNNHNEKYPYCSIPTLEEVLQLVKPTQMDINIELKTGVFHYDGIIEKTFELVEKYQMQDRIIYSSFNHNTVKEIKEKQPTAYTGFLHTDCIIDLAKYAKENGADALHPAYYFLIYPEYLMEAKKYGLDINSWTINEEQYIAMALQLGINCIITNYPDLAIAIRDKMK